MTYIPNAILRHDKRLRQRVVIPLGDDAETIKAFDAWAKRLEKMNRENEAKPE